MTMIESAVPRSGCSMISPTTRPDHRYREQRVLQIVDPIHPPLENRRDEEDDRDLGELGRLPPIPATPNHRRAPLIRPPKSTPTRARTTRPNAVQITSGWR
jgi:hypothetical protein